jgi:hypothetical protein
MTNVTGVARAKNDFIQARRPKVSFVSLGCARAWAVAVD